MLSALRQLTMFHTLARRCPAPLATRATLNVEEYRSGACLGQCSLRSVQQVHTAKAIRCAASGPEARPQIATR